MTLTKRQRKRARSVARRIAAEYERELATIFASASPWVVEAFRLEMNEARARAREQRAYERAVRREQAVAA